MELACSDGIAEDLDGEIQFSETSFDFVLLLKKSLIHSPLQLDLEPVPLFLPQMRRKKKNLRGRGSSHPKLFLIRFRPLERLRNFTGTAKDVLLCTTSKSDHRCTLFGGKDPFDHLGIDVDGVVSIAWRDERN